MEKWDALVIALSILTSSLPILLIATLFGLISIATIIGLFGPLVPLLVCAFIGWTLYDKTKTENPYVAIILLVFLLIVGVFIMLTVGYQTNTPGW